MELIKITEEPISSILPTTIPNVGGMVNVGQGNIPLRSFFRKITSVIHIVINTYDAIINTGWDISISLDTMKTVTKSFIRILETITPLVNS